MINTYNNYHIAIVEDDSVLREELSHFLRGHGLVVSEVNNAISLNELLLEEPIQLVILDLNLPGQNGLEIAKHIRANLPEVRIIMVTGRTTLPDRIQGYDSGADIFLPKPVSSHELLSAISSIYKRQSAPIKPDSWQLNTSTRQITPADDSTPITLTAIEMTLLLALVRAPNRTLDSEILCEILQKNCGNEDVSKRALENSISRLRKKLQTEDNPNNSSIRSVWGRGYQLCIPIISV